MFSVQVPVIRLEKTATSIFFCLLMTDYLQKNMQIIIFCFIKSLNSYSTGKSILLPNAHFQIPILLTVSTVPKSLSMMKNIKKYLFDIKVAIESIEEYVKNISDIEAYQQNKLVRRAVEREIEIIGEATNKILKLDDSI